MLGIFLYCLPATLALQTTSVVNVLGHGHGMRPHDTRDISTNSWIADLISLGEGKHNTHHMYPRLYKLGPYDFIGWFIERIKS